MAFQKSRLYLKQFRERYSLRFHMTLILLATACSGVLSSKLLLLAHVDNFALRYPIAVIFSYMVFFVCIKLWLMYVTPGSGSNSGSSVVDASDVPIVWSGGGSSPTASSMPVMQGGGGGFSGGGASGSFDIDSDVATESIASAAVSDVASGAGDGVGDGVGDVVGGVGDALGDDGGIAVIIVIAVLAILLAAVLGASVYVIYQAPVILSEAALQGILASSLTRHTKAMAQDDWVGSVFKTTWKPFACMLAAALVLNCTCTENG